MQRIRITTKKKREVVAITDTVNRALQELEHTHGLCHLFLLHTTAALTTADLDPGTDLDMLDAFEFMVPAHEIGEARPAGRPQLKYRHPHDPSHVPDHILSTLIGTSLTLPFEQKKLVLGTWQEVVLIEFDGPRERTIHFSILQSIVLRRR